LHNYVWPGAIEAKCTVIGGIWPCPSHPLVAVPKIVWLAYSHGAALLARYSHDNCRDWKRDLRRQLPFIASLRRKRMQLHLSNEKFRAKAVIKTCVSCLGGSSTEKFVTCLQAADILV